jgi:TolB protein
MKKSAFLIFIGLCIISPAHPNLNAQNNDLILAYDGFPAWSPDGTHIAFVSGRSGNYDLWVMNIDGSNPTNLTQTPEQNELSSRWSPDGQYITYITAPLGEGFYDPIAGQAYYDLWVMRRDGTNRILLSTELEGGSGNPEWSPDEQAIAFISGIPSSLEEARQFQSNIWLVEPDGSNLTNLTNTQDETYTDLSWSPDSRQLAFINSSQGILLYNLDNQQTTVLTSHRIDTEVAWADNFLAVTTMYINDDDIYSIWSMNSDGTNRLILTRNNPGLDWHPVWSSDGDHIAYESSNAPHNDSRDIWVVDRDGYNAANLTADLDGWSMKPDWSPDGQQIVFEYNEGDFEIAGLDGESDIWIMNTDGSEKINLTE